MTDLNIITGKILVSLPSSVVPEEIGNKKMYVKVFTGTFTMKAPRPKKAKVLYGELIVRYSEREWPEKKYGSIINNQSVVDGVVDLLKSLGLANFSEVSWAKEQQPIKGSITLKVGQALAQEIIDRGWAILV